MAFVSVASKVLQWSALHAFSPCMPPISVSASACGHFCVFFECMHAWLCGGGGGGVCSVQHRGGMQTMCVCVCARLAAGSLAITLYEVWQGEGKTSALGS